MNAFAKLSLAGLIVATTFPLHETHAVNHRSCSIHVSNKTISKPL